MPDDRCENEEYQDARAATLQDVLDILYGYDRNDLRLVAWQALTLSNGPEVGDVESDAEARTSRFYVNYADGWLGPTFSITDKGDHQSG